MYLLGDRNLDQLDFHLSGAAGAACQLAAQNRGGGGISKSQAIPPAQSYRQGNPHQQHLTSQQIYQQNYYYMRKYQKQRAKLQEDLLRDDLHPGERESKTA